MVEITHRLKKAPSFGVLSWMVVLAIFVWASNRADADTATGRVANFRGAPVKDAHVVIVMDDSEKPLLETVTDEKGMFSFNLLSLPATLVVAAEGLSPQHKRIEANDDLEKIQFRLLPGRRARLQFVDQENKPVERVLLRSIDWHVNGTEHPIRGIDLSGESDSHGSCTIDSMPAGTVTFEFRHAKFQTEREAIRAGSEVHKVVLLPRSDEDVVARLDEQAKELSYQINVPLDDDEWLQSEQIVFKAFNAAESVQQGDGFAVAISKGNKWQQGQMACQVTLAGDFDVEADTEILDWDALGGNAGLVIALADGESTRFSVERHVGPHRERILSHLHWQEDGQSHHEHRPKPQSSLAGTLRIARRDATFFALWRSASDENFIIVDKRELNQSSTKDAGVVLAVSAPINGQIMALWKRMRVRSERLIDHSKQSEKQFVLSVYDYKTNDIRRICTVIPPQRTTGSPAWSPDEKWIAYDTLKESTRDSRIMIVTSDEGTPTDIGAGSMPSFSPDGERIAFSSATEGLGIMNADGSDRVILNQRGWDLQWSPTGQLSFASGGQFFLIDRNGNSIGPLMKGAAGTRYRYLNWNSTWSNSGKKIVFKGRRASDGLDELAVWDTNNPEDITVLLNDFGQRHVDFSWSSDDTIVYVISSGSALQQQIVGLAADGSGMTFLAPFGIDFDSPTSAAWSPSGERIAITGRPSNERQRRIYRMTSAGKDLKRLTNRFMGNADHLSPAISPNGNDLAFELFDGEPRRSRILCVKTEDLSWNDFGLGCIPSFTDDGKRIFYSSFSGMKSLDLSSGVTQVQPMRGNWTLTASPVNDSYASIRNHGAEGANIVLESATGRVPRYLLESEIKTRYEQIPFYFAFSFDGSKVAFIGNRKNQLGRELAVVSTKGSNTDFQVVADGRNLHNDVAWHPDGKQLVVARRDSNEGYYRLYLMPIMNAQNATLLPGQPLDADNREPVYSLDGESLFFSSKPISVP